MFAYVSFQQQTLKEAQDQLENKKTSREKNLTVIGEQRKLRLLFIIVYAK